LAVPIYPFSCSYATSSFRDDPGLAKEGTWPTLAIDADGRKVGLEFL
jgi:hypothetical protein